MNRPMVKQCLMIKGNASTVAWIPIEHAKKGKVLDTPDGDGWIVKEVWSGPRPAAMDNKHRNPFGSLEIQT